MKRFKSHYYIRKQKKTSLKMVKYYVGLFVLAMLLGPICKWTQYQFSTYAEFKTPTKATVVEEVWVGPTLTPTPAVYPSGERLSENEVKSLVDQMFPKNARETFLRILQCENGTHQVDRVNINKDHSYDLGIAQINNYWHKSQVEQMFNMPFRKAMSDPFKNVKFASYLYKSQGNFSAWTCAHILKII